MSVWLFAKYLPTCEFHCWALSTNGRCFLSPDDRLTVRQNHIFSYAPRLQLFTFQSVVVCSWCVVVIAAVAFFLLCWLLVATVWLICCLCVRFAHNFRQTTLLIIKTEIYHTIKSKWSTFFFFSLGYSRSFQLSHILALWSSLINKLFGFEQMILFPFSKTNWIQVFMKPK